MNWTGGSLSRSRRHNTNISTIQKKHFARARGKLLNGRPPPHRIDLTVFQDVEHDRRLGSHFSAHDARQVRQSSQMIMEDFGSMRPVVRRLQSMRPRHATKSPHTKTSQSDGSHGRREANARAFKSVSQRSRTLPATEELEVKRRELLGTFDWVGLEKTKPVQMKFADAEDRDLIGKRRILKGNPGPGESVARTSIHRRPVIQAYEKLNMMRARPNVPTSPQKISIHIGSSPKGSLSSIARHISTSDEMLFDEKAEARAAVHRPALPHSISTQSGATSEEMLLDQEWSDQASGQRLKHPYTNRSLYQRPSHPGVQIPPSPMHGQGIRSGLGLETSNTQLSHGRVHSGRPARHRFSQGSEMISSSALEDVDETLDRDQAQQEMTSNDAHFSYPGDNAVSRVAYFAGLEPYDAFNDNQGLIPPNTKLNDDEDSRLDEERKLLHKGQSAIDRQVDHLSYTRLGPRQDTGHQISGDIAHRLASLPPLYEISNEASYDGNLHKDSTTPSTGASSEKAWRALIERGLYEKPSNPNGKADANETLATRISSPQVLAKDSEAVAQQAATKPHLCPPIVEPPAPADPTPEEDELLWRTFVFGTEDPANDWKFEDPIIKSAVPAPQRDRSNSSSPLQPLSAAPETNTETHNPIPQTQPSLLVEPSSTSPPNPETPTPNPSTSHHSNQTQAPSNPPANPTTTSSDPLAFSPSRFPPPTIVFRKPERYTGDSRYSIPAVRLGTRKKKRSEGEGERDGMQRKHRVKRQKGRDRAWEWGGGGGGGGGGGTEAQEGWEEEVDEIVD
ncbi:MAG: hypothetical protein Q9182_001307 [Xanthomendoza sp. 2 TL-2023]